VAKLVYNKNLKREKKVHFVPPLFIATNATHFPYYCICFFPLQKLWILQHNNIFFIIVCLRFLLSHVFFLLLLLSTSQIQICFMTFYFSPFIAGLLFQLLFNYLHVTGSLNTTFLLSHWSYRCTFIFKLGLILYAFFIAIFVFSILCVICFKSMRIFSCVHVSSISWLGFLFDFLFFHGIFISFPFIFSILTMLLKLPWLTIFDNLNLSFNF
jgi:hypothetical protein